MSLISDIAESDFRSSVVDGGLPLTWQSPNNGAVTFGAMVEVVEPEKDPFASQPSDDVTAMISALRSDFAAAGSHLPRPQDLFVDGGTRYQVQQVRNLHGTPFVNFRARIVT